MYTRRLSLLFVSFWVFSNVFLLFAEEKLGDSSLAENAQDKNLFDAFLLYSLVEEVGHTGRNVLWNPDWPSIMPPDAFVLVSGKARSIDLILGPLAENSSPEAPKGIEHYTARWDSSGHLLELPYFNKGPAFLVRINRYSSGKISTLSLADVAPNTDKDAGRETEIKFEFFDSDMPSQASISTAEGTQNLVFRHYADIVEQTIYDDSAMVISHTEYTMQGNLPHLIRRIASDGKESSVTRLEYNSNAMLSAFEDEDQFVEIVYDSLARPAALYRKRPNLETYYFQCDERGFLVRKKHKIGDEPPFETTYTYEINKKGDWTKCTAIIWKQGFGKLIPGTPLLMERQIQY